MHIGLANTSLTLARGGTERACVALAHAMLSKGHKIYIYTHAYTKNIVYPLDRSITCRFVNILGGRQSDIARIRAQMQADQLDVIVSMHSNASHMLWALCCLGTGIPFICSERSDPAFSESVTWNRPSRHAVLACADAIHELLPCHAQTVPKMWRDKVCIIPNAIPTQEISQFSNTKTKRILFLARYIPSKRADLLIKAFALITNDFPDWTLHLHGHGPEHAALAKLVHRLGLGKTAFVHGLCDDPAKEYENAAIYCLPTKVEGFPNTVLEAMHAGLPIVGVADCPAMQSLVAHEKTGLLAATASPEDLASCLRQLVVSTQLREDMGRKAFMGCRQKFDSQHIFDQWENFLFKMTQHKGHTVMDTFATEPFTSRARLSAVARREWLFREFGQPVPYGPGWYGQRICHVCKNLIVGPKS